MICSHTINKILAKAHWNSFVPVICYAHDLVDSQQILANKIMWPVIIVYIYQCLLLQVITSQLITSHHVISYVLLSLIVSSLYLTWTSLYIKRLLQLVVLCLLFLEFAPNIVSSSLKQPGVVHANFFLLIFITPFDKLPFRKLTTSHRPPKFYRIWMGSLSQQEQLIKSWDEDCGEEKKGLDSPKDIGERDWTLHWHIRIGQWRTGRGLFGHVCNCDFLIISILDNFLNPHVHNLLVNVLSSITVTVFSSSPSQNIFSKSSSYVSSTLSSMLMLVSKLSIVSISNGPLSLSSIVSSALNWVLLNTSIILMHLLYIILVKQVCVWMLNECSQI